jgi:WD repeat-containing protein 90
VSKVAQHSVWCVQVTDIDKKVNSAPAGMAVSAGHDVFTDLAFEQGTSVTLLNDRHVYVSAVSGAVYQINYDAHALEAVYQLHNAAINSIAVNEGFAITGSDDKYLRVWPLDFTDYFLEAEHETAVTSVGVSPDGLQVCIGTENGSLGMLDIASHKYTTLLRSHSDAINSMAVDGSGAHCVTGSSDGKHPHGARPHQRPL